MKNDFNSFKQTAQDFLLRLFVAPESDATLPPRDGFVCSRNCGTYARLHQYE